MNKATEIRKLISFVEVTDKTLEKSDKLTERQMAF